MKAHPSRYLLLLIACVVAGCATIIPPGGGKKDTTPPKLVSITPADSLLNTRVSHLTMYFDEYITLSDASKEVEISPILAVPPTVLGINKHVTVKVPDSLLEDNTTYHISFGKAIKDLHEGNAFGNYVYTFSTGSYFDSLQLSGNIHSAETGLPDTGNIYILLYNASKSDSAVVREKPKYVTKTNAQGDFTFKGLPKRKFHIYALKDPNGNLIYDGPGELIGFYGKTVTPGDSDMGPINMNIFPEPADTGLHAKNDTPSVAAGKRPMNGKQSKEKEGFGYYAALDTSDIRKRTFDITRPIQVSFNRVPTINASRITLTYDSAGIAVPIGVRDSLDTGKRSLYLFNDHWQENTVYTLRLLKGFAKDTGKTDAMPSRYTFRTEREDDYGTMEIHLPTKYYGKQYLLYVISDKDTIYRKPALDSTVYLKHLRPGNYLLRVVHDKNENGKWDTGNLFEKLQPEEVIPYTGGLILLKAGFEDIMDFEQKKKAGAGAPR